ncbi:hypothetical protein B0G84_4016 [Paraburkholderia sp. BL8N3]|jgi:hypothetical protein|nr:DUF6130 family protein [Paraburkholderia sp. BL8N3]TCK38699.1 hypothetical protein B0G84_4016 [Paraburkholderia sp. BL8N3]
MPLPLRHIAVAAAGAIFCAAAWAQSAADIARPAAVIPLESEPAAKLITYPPLAGPLARGVVIIQFRTENLRIMPVFGNAAVDVSPHLGHIHVTVDDWHGTWAHTSEDPVILVGLEPGKHKILLELADPSHKILSGETVTVTVPEQKAPKAKSHEHGQPDQG